MKKIFLISTLFFAFVIALSAQSQKVTVVIEGLACPFCAYGLEKSFKEGKGVTNVIIDIDQGEMTFDLEAGNTMTEKEIRKKVKDAGFKAKEISFQKQQDDKQEIRN